MTPKLIAEFVVTQEGGVEGSAWNIHQFSAPVSCDSRSKEISSGDWQPLGAQSDVVEEGVWTPGRVRAVKGGTWSE
jgi:hypothetical protein